MSIHGVGGGSPWLPVDNLPLGPAPADSPLPAETPSNPGTADRANATWNAHVSDPQAGVVAARLTPSSASQPLLRIGARGAAVRDLQERLNEFRAKLDLPPLPVDGHFGPGTKSALVEFQKLRGLDPDGVAGPATWRKLLGETPVQPPQPRAGSLEAKVLRYRDEILSAAESTGVPPELIAGVIAKESSGRADAVAATGDKGLMQINEKAHPEFFANHDWRNPQENIDYGAGYLRRTIRAFAGRAEPAIAAYNAGVGGVRRGLRRGKSLDEITFKPGYVDDVLRYARRMAPYF